MKIYKIERDPESHNPRQWRIKTRLTPKERAKIVRVSERDWWVTIRTHKLYYNHVKRYFACYSDGDELEVMAYMLKFAESLKDVDHN